MNGLERRVQKLQGRGVKYVVHKGNIFTESNGIISASAAACHGLRLDPEDCDLLLQHLGGMVVRWTDGFRAHNKPESEWYSVICRRCLAVEELSKKKRYTLRRSKDQCTVRRIGAEELAETGYLVHLQALKRYGANTNAAPTPDEFRHNVAREKEYPDLVHNWGVYHNDRLIGYAQNQVFGMEEVNYSTIKLDPEFLEFSPGYALIYSMNEYYLGECGYGYVNDGFRSVLHDTNIQSFLINTFGFEKAYTTLSLHYRSPIGMLMAMAYPFRTLLGKFHRHLSALLELERCRRFS